MLKKIKKYQAQILLGLIFLLALVLRFWWFPENVYFGYDQARDAFVSQAIYQNKDFKIIGPGADTTGLFHGPLYWYVQGPLYLLSRGNPAFVLGTFSLLNALGVFLIYFLGKTAFNQKAGLLAALFYAFSFSQTQYALYFSNPAPAVLTVALFYLGWIFISQKKSIGWLLVSLGFGLSVQFEFVLVYLAVSALVLGIFLRKDLAVTLNPKTILTSTFAIVITLSTFILAELKYNFRTIRTLTEFFVGITGDKSEGLAGSSFWGRVGDELSYFIWNGLPNHFLVPIVFLALILFGAFRFPRYKKSLLIVFVWLFSNFSIDIIGAPQLYQIGVGLSLAVIIFSAFLIEQLSLKSDLFLLLALPLLLNNLNLISKINPHGPLKALNVQDGMLLSQEKRILDHIYTDSNKNEFVVNALTMPYNIKTTWAYLFNWYGRQKYGYVPYWGGEDVPGYAGQMPLSSSSSLVRYAIYEPERGIPEELKKIFVDSENGFGKPVAREEIGQFVIEKRVPTSE